MASTAQIYKAHAQWNYSQVPQYLEMAKQAIKEETKERYINMARRYRDNGDFYTAHAETMEK